MLDMSTADALGAVIGGFLAAGVIVGLVFSALGLFVHR
jgi:hypothetical protein